MANIQASVNLRQLYSELAKSDKSGDYERALKACNKIIKAYPNDSLALQCKLVSLIQLSKFEDALSLYKKLPPGINATFEKAYSEYRLNRTEESIKTLRAVTAKGEELDFRCQELLAQLLYRAEQYKEAHQIYKNLLKNYEDEFDETRRANKIAVATHLQLTSNDPDLHTAISDSSYEQCFNEACRLATAGEIGKARKMLQKAEEACRQALAEDEVPEEDIEEELAGIRAQVAYCMQQSGDAEGATKIYNDILKQKPNDMVLVAVASNNLLSIRKEQNLFDARKKLKACMTSQVEQKLNRQQKSVISLNNALVLLHSNQLEPCRRAIDDLRRNYGSNETSALCEAALLIRQKDYATGIENLQQYISSKGAANCSMAIHFALTQLLLLNDDHMRVIEHFRTLGDNQHLPAILSLMVTVAQLNNDPKTALEILSAGVDWRKRLKNAATDQLLPALIEECASLYARTGDQKTATRYLEDLRRMRPNDPAILGRLINAYLQFDPKKAEEICRTLPPSDSLTSSLDIDALENANWTVLGTKYVVKKATRAGETPKTDRDGNVVLAKKHKKKRKKRLPKNYDPNGPPPDPERWLPKYERAAYKKKKDKRAKERDIGRGTQGTVGSGDTEVSATTQVSSPKPTPTPSGSGPRQMRPGGQKPKSKKGKGK